MNNKLSALLTAAVVTGLLASQTALAEDSSEVSSGDQTKVEKNSCKGQAADKNSCKGAAAAKKQKKKSDKNSCKNGCGEAKGKKDETK